MGQSPVLPNLIQVPLRMHKSIGLSELAWRRSRHGLTPKPTKVRWWNQVTIANQSAHLNYNLSELSEVERSGVEKSSKPLISVDFDCFWKVLAHDF